MKFNILNKKNLIVGVVLVLAITGCVSIFGKNKKVEVTQQDVKNVKVKKIAIGSISNEVEYASKLNPVQEIIVFPKTGGKVSSVNVDIGDKVTAGQVLFTLDTAELQAQLQAQQAALTASNANLARTSDSGLQQQIKTSEQAVSKSKLAHDDAKANYDKMQKLYDAGVISKQELDNVKLRYDNSSLDLKSAQDNLNLLIEKSGPQSIQAASAQVAQAQAGVNAVQVQLNNASITSPIDGVVSAKDVKVGQLAGGQSGSVTIIDSSSFIAEVSVPDKVIGKIKIGQSVQISISALDNKKVTGTIDKISPNSNARDNSYTVKVKIDSSTSELRAGMFARVSLPSEKKDKIVIVPNEALKMENNVNYLYIADNGNVKKISVTTGISNEKVTEVTGSIKEGMEVIVEGQNLLSNGDKVNAVK
ncbi:MAG: efflux RND transporter periplasmic adaptor subunit [Clostridium lundense]|nr:efflux RND transporter periplasmic adaptor subunit [Clostridium lundense]